MTDDKVIIVDMTDWDENGEDNPNVYLSFFDKNIFVRKD